MIMASASDDSAAYPYRISPHDDGVFLFWHELDNEEKKNILHIGVDELKEQLENLGMKQVRDTVVEGALNDAKLVTHVRYEFVKALYNEGNFEIEDVKEPIVKGMVQCLEWHLIYSYEEALTARKAMLLVCIFISMIEIHLFWRTLSICIIAYYALVAAPRTQFWLFAHIMMLFDDRDFIEYLHPEDRPGKLVELQRVDRSKNRMLSFTNGMLCLQLARWFSQEQYILVIVIAILPLIIIDCELIMTKSLYARAVKHARQTVSIAAHFMLLYLVWYSKLLLLTCAAIFLPLAMNLMVTACLFGPLTCLELFSMIRPFIIRSNRYVIIWIAWITSAYFLYIGSSSWLAFGLKASICLVLLPTGLDSLIVSVLAIVANANMKLGIGGICLLVLKLAVLIVSVISVIIYEGFIAKEYRQLKHGGNFNEANVINHENETFTAVAAIR